MRLRALHRRSLAAAMAPQEGGLIEVLGPAGNATLSIAGKQVSGPESP